MSPTPEDAVRSGGIYHQCVQELQKPHPGLRHDPGTRDAQPAETLQEVAWRVAELSRQITLASKR
jgi:hypothetical protein